MFKLPAHKSGTAGQIVNEITLADYIERKQDKEEDKGFPQFQTVEWWIEQLKEYNPKAVVAIYTGYGEKPNYMLSMYPVDGRLDDHTKCVAIDIGRD